MRRHMPAPSMPRRPQPLGLARLGALALAGTLWLGGWHGPFADTLGWLWTLLKGFAVAVLVIWVRVAWPRLREDQLQRLAWLWLVPLALLQLLLTGAGVVLGW